jgi:ribosomal-protein-alanine N-acetyltransferase
MIMLTEAHVAHGQAMAAIHAAAFPPAERWGADALALQLSLPGAFGWIADQDGFILARVAADEAEILTLAVHPNRRRAGLGAALLEAALRKAADCGAIAMLLEVAEPNEAAHALYTQFGFTEVGRRKRYYSDGTDALVLRRALGMPQP